jgi:F0F1-type ATP synthase delta subunit
LKYLPRHELAQVIAEMSLKDGVTPRLAEATAAYLLEERRYFELDSLLRDVQRYWASVGYVDVLARVARALPEDAYEDLLCPFKSRYPEAKRLNVTPVFDPAVIGGANLELGEQRMDISFARRLRRFKKAINVKGS